MDRSAVYSSLSSFFFSVDDHSDKPPPSKALDKEMVITNFSSGKTKLNKIPLNNPVKIKIKAILFFLNILGITKEKQKITK